LSFLETMVLFIAGLTGRMLSREEAPKICPGRFSISDQVFDRYGRLLFAKICLSDPAFCRHKSTFCFYERSYIAFTERDKI
jgi:hypothetical protein